MEQFAPKEVRQQEEIGRMKKTLEQNKRFGTFDIAAVGDAGYIVSRKGSGPSQTPQVGVFEFDFDDVLVHTTNGLRKLVRLFKLYLTQSGILLSDSMLGTLIAQTEQFASWAGTVSAVTIYHPEAHMASLDWIVEGLKILAADVDREQWIETKLARLNEIKNELYMGSQTKPLKSEPFFFTTDRVFHFRDTDRRWAKEIEDIFLSSFLRPSCIKETYQAATALKSESAEVGIFTLGDPTWQLSKIFSSFYGQKTLPFSHFLLANNDKGDFVRALDTVKRNKHMPRHAMGPIAKTGVIVVVDDNPDSLKSIISLNSPASPYFFAGIRYRLKGGHNEEEEWNLLAPNMEVKYEKEPTSEEILETLFYCRSIAYEEKFGVDHPDTIKAREVWQLYKHPQ